MINREIIDQNPIGDKLVRNFDPNVIFPDRLAKVLGLYRREGLDVRLAGSLGRAAALKQSISFFNPDGHIRDIDVMVVGPNTESVVNKITDEARRAALPLEVGLLFENGCYKIGNDAAIAYRDIKMDVDPSVLDSRKSILFGVPVITLDPNTLFHIAALSPSLRIKDKLNLLAYGRLLRGNTEMLPEEYFVSFHQLLSSKRSVYKFEKMLEGVRRFYWRIVTPEKRARLFFLTRPLHHISRKTCRLLDNLQ